MRIILYFTFVFFALIVEAQIPENKIFVSGETPPEVEFLTIAEDTIYVKDGEFSDSLFREQSEYNYLRLDSWKWPRIVYLESGKSISFDFRKEYLNVEDDLFNEFLLNTDSILTTYTARWDFTDSEFRKTWQKELPVNLEKIDNFFAGSQTPQLLIDELKQMELMKRAHRTANFISFQEKKDKPIDRNIYAFVDSIDLKNERLAFHVNNRNFQYYYFLDKVSPEVPDSVYPFAAIDTVLKYVSILDIRNMIIGKVVKSGLYDETVNHDDLFLLYEKYIGKISKDDKIVKLYQKIQDLKVGNKAPEFGELYNLQGAKISLEDFKGKNILLSAWGTWCPYCKEELAPLNDLFTKYPDKFENVAISLDKDAEIWKGYLGEIEWPAHHLIDPNKQSTFRNNYLISGTNLYFLIDKSGIIIASYLKPSNEQLEELIKSLD